MEESSGRPARVDDDLPHHQVGLPTSIPRCRASTASASCASMVVSARARSTPASSSRPEQRRGAKIDASRIGHEAAEERHVDRDRHAVEPPDAVEMEQRRARRDAEFLGLVEGGRRPAARSTSEDGVSPSRAAVSLNDSSVFGNSFGTSAETYQPRPCEAVSTPSSTRLCSARRSVTRLIESWVSRSRSAGRRRPRRACRSAIWCAIRSAACRHSGSGNPRRARRPRHRNCSSPQATFSHCPVFIER